MMGAPLAVAILAKRHEDGEGEKSDKKEMSAADYDMAFADAFDDFYSAVQAGEKDEARSALKVAMEICYYKNQYEDDGGSHEEY